MTRMCTSIVVFLTCLLGCSVVVSGIRVQSVSQAIEELNSREKRDAPPSPTERGEGVFGNQTLIFKTECVLMEVENVGIQVKSASEKGFDVDQDISNIAYSVSGGENCLSGANNMTGVTDLTAKFTGFLPNSSISEASFTFEFTRNTYSWWISNVSLSLRFQNASMQPLDENLETRDIGAGLGYAYLCQDYDLDSFFAQFDYGKQQPVLRLNNVIMQPFLDVSNGTYGQLEPCEYAFTIPLWMATVTGLIMSVILALGISMLASIRTMDRFDDPKTSKLLSVPSE